MKTFFAVKRGNLKNKLSNAITPGRPHIFVHIITSIFNMKSSTRDLMIKKIVCTVPIGVKATCVINTYTVQWSKNQWRTIYTSQAGNF
jgi:hypothetical protein